MLSFAPFLHFSLKISRSSNPLKREKDPTAAYQVSSFQAQNYGSFLTTVMQSPCLKEQDVRRKKNFFLLILKIQFAFIFLRKPVIT